MMRLSVAVDDGRARRRLAALTAVQRANVLRRAVNDGAQVVGPAARRIAPVDTGALRESIQSRNWQTGPGYATVDVGPAVHYAVFVELGTGIYYPGGRRTPWTYFSQRRQRFVTTRGMRPRRYMRRTFEHHGRSAKAAMEAVLLAPVRRAVRL